MSDPPAAQQTPVTSDKSKRVLSSPLDRDDIKKQRALSSSSNMSDKPDMEEISNQPAQLSLKDEDLQRISALLASSFEARLTTIVSNVVDGVLNNLSTKVDTLEKENAGLRTKVNAIQSKLDQAVAELEQANQYSRRNCVRVSGLPESPDELTDDAILNVAKEVGCAISLSDIDRSHRLGKPKLGSQQASSNKPRDIVVKFISYRARSSFMRSKSKLKDSKFKRVFINEHLTPLRNDLFYQARQLAKMKVIDSAWTFDGTIKIKNAAGRVIRIETQGDLDMCKRSGNYAA